jgi:hypothetical protein
MRYFLLSVFLLLAPGIKNCDIPGFPSTVTANQDTYTNLNLAEAGLTRNIFNLALKGLNKLVNLGKLHNPDIVTIADYSQSSTKKRLYVIDLKNHKLLFNTFVAHGRNTGDEYARSFSNDDGSLQSSLGFYVTNEPMTGSHTGISLMIDGIEKGFNDHAARRAIIIHGAYYATESYIRKYGRLGRSYGCPAVPPDMVKPIIETIKEGTCLFIYNPIDNYLRNSALLN